jgi:hypothetical protein
MSGEEKQEKLKEVQNNFQLILQKEDIEKFPAFHVQILHLLSILCRVSDGASRIDFRYKKNAYYNQKSNYISSYDFNNTNGVIAQALKLCQESAELTYETYLLLIQFVRSWQSYLSLFKDDFWGKNAQKEEWSELQPEDKQTYESKGTKIGKILKKMTDIINDLKV